MWDPAARARHSRVGLRCGSDLTDAEWAIVAPLLPEPRDRGRHRRWRCGGFEGLNHQLVQIDRARVGREPMPSAAVIDSLSVKTTEAGGPCGYDAGKKVKGRKRHAMVDTDGRTLELLAHPADVQDRDGAVPLLELSRGRRPFMKLPYADSAYASPRVAMATSADIKIVRKLADQTGFVVHPAGGSLSTASPG